MLLEAIFNRFRREQVPINDAELETLERDGPRALNYLVSQGAARARSRVVAVAATLLFLVLAAWKLHWSGAGLLAFVVYGAVLTFLIDAMGQFMAQRWQLYGHARALRMAATLAVGSSLEGGSGLRPALAPQAPPATIIRIAGAATLLGLPLLWFALSRTGWASWDSVFANRFMPLFMLLIGAWRLLRGFLGVVRVRGSSVGTYDLYVNSDDVLDTYVLALVLSILAAPLGAAALIWVAFLVVVLRLLAAIDLWWRQRKALALLQRRIRRTHPDTPVSKSTWGESESGGAVRG